MALEFEKNNHWLRVGWSSIRVIDDRLHSAVKLLLNFPPALLFYQHLYFLILDLLLVVKYLFRCFLTFALRILTVHNLCRHYHALMHARMENVANLP